MKKSITMILISALLFTLVGCGAPRSEASGRDNTMLGGSYEVGIENYMDYYKVVCTFTEENEVMVRYVSMGNTLYQQSGTYELDQERENITLTFPVIPSGTTIPYIGMSSFSGTYSFSEEDGAIYIGEIYLHKATEDK